MATVDELQRLDLEIDDAERRALRALAAHLRDGVRDLPSESRLARVFVRHAATFEVWAAGSAPGAWGTTEVEMLRRGIWAANSEDVLADLSTLMLAAAEQLYPGDWRSCIERFARSIEPVA